MKIICLHLNENTERYNHIMNEHIRMGLENDLYISSFTKLPINNIIGDRLPELKTNHYEWVRLYTDKNVYGNVFSCLYNWILLISQALDSDEESVLFIEDDVSYTCDKETLQYYIENIPKDADMIHFGCQFSTGYSNNGQSDFLTRIDDELFIKCNANYKLVGMFGVWMNKKGMRYWLDYVQTHICSSDLLFTDIYNDIQKSHGVNIYLPNKKLIRHNFNFKSNIQ